jgi:sec-independent protein translocase protein TatC
MAPILKFLPPGESLKFFALADAFTLNLKVSLWTGLLVSSPFTLYQLWAFLAPGLLPQEKKKVPILSLMAFVLFALGVLFAYFLVWPLTFQFFLGFSSPTIQPLLAGKEYVSLVLGLTLVFALAFQLPLALMFLGKLGLVTADTLKKYRPYAIVGFFVVGAILTPPDVLSQCFLAITLCLLYELSVLLTPKAKKPDLEESEETPADPLAEAASSSEARIGLTAEPLAPPPLDPNPLGDANSLAAPDSPAELAMETDKADRADRAEEADQTDREDKPDKTKPAEPDQPAAPGELKPMGSLLDYSAAILCGGLSHRMGSDKAFLRDAAGKLLLASLAEKLAAFFGETRLIADRPDKFKAFPELNYPVDADLYPRSGPVGAILTALAAGSGRTFFVLAGDQPVLDLNVVEKLKDLLEKTQADVALPRREGGALEPLYAFYGPGCQEPFTNSLKAGRLAIRASFSALKVSYLDLSPKDIPPGLFKNLNDPKEAQAFGYAPG